MNGKGSKPRPYSLDLETFSANWDSIFKPKPCTTGKDQVYFHSPKGTHKPKKTKEGNK